VKFIHQLRDRFPSVQIVCLCPFSGDQGAGVLLGATELMKTDKRVHLLDTQMWLSPDEFFDGRHPNMFGSLHAAQRLSDELRPLLAP